MAVKIRLLRMGKIRDPQYRIVVADSRTKRDGRAIEYVGLYHPKEEPSRIEVDSARVQHWLSVGAQPTDRVLRFLDELDISKRPARNNPTRAIPRKQRKVMAEEAAKAAAAAKAAKSATATAAS